MMKQNIAPHDSASKFPEGALAVPEGWRELLQDEFSQPYWSALQEFVAAERAHHQVYPPKEKVYTALETTSCRDTNVVLLGQDPYAGKGQAHGLCFSVLPDVSVPPSLRNIFKELHADVGCDIPTNGYLMPWARQGILMLNSVLTVRANEANSHKGKGWEMFTDSILRTVNAKADPVVFVLWGSPARKKLSLINKSRHVVVESAHPSPLSARHGFFGSRPFSRINDALLAAGKSAIDWKLPNL